MMLNWTISLTRLYIILVNSLVIWTQDSSVSDIGPGYTDASGTPVGFTSIDVSGGF